MPEKRFVIDFDKVRSVEDVERILEAVDLSFSEQATRGISDLVKEVKVQGTLIPYHLEPLDAEFFDSATRKSQHIIRELNEVDALFLRKELQMLTCCVGGPEHGKQVEYSSIDTGLLVGDAEYEPHWVVSDIGMVRVLICGKESDQRIDEVLHKFHMSGGK